MAVVKRRLVNTERPGTAVHREDTDCTMRVGIQAVFETIPFLAGIEHQFAHKSEDMKTVG